MRTLTNGGRVIEGYSYRAIVSTKQNGQIIEQMSNE